MINEKGIIDKIVQWLHNETAPVDHKCVIGVSGGIDSSVTLSLAIEAVGLENVFAFFLPSAITPPNDLKDIYGLESSLGIKIKKINIQEIIDEFTGIFDTKDNKVLGNIVARTRMVILYYFANKYGAMVINTCNLSEDFVGYTTKYGDSAGDLSPLGLVLKRDIYRMAKHLDIPKSILKKTPSAGLWEKQADEVELGVSYGAIDTFISKIISGKTVGEIRSNAKVYGLSVEGIDRIVDLHLKNKHKMLGIKLMGKQPML